MLDIWLWPGFISVVNLPIEEINIGYLCTSKIIVMPWRALFQQLSSKAKEPTIQALEWWWPQISPVLPWTSLQEWQRNPLCCPWSKREESRMQQRRQATASGEENHESWGRQSVPEEVGTRTPPHHHGVLTAYRNFRDYFSELLLDVIPPPNHREQASCSLIPLLEEWM